MTASLANRLLVWYERNARRLPWRDRPDPYAIWISEIMLQQTRVETVIPYFERWMERFPSLQALASASQQQVLAAWEGLGYYSRARNLHKAAQIVVARHDGRLPQDSLALQRLPGIGRYTAAAIASIAFGADEGALDGNVRRVFSRVFDLRLPARSTEGEKQLWKLLKAHLPPGRAAEFNQALMDLGALVCTPRSPDCPDCPLVGICAAYALGVQEERPVKAVKSETPHHIVTAAVIHQNGHVLIARRPEDGLLGGLWEFPGGKLEPGEDLAGCLQREICEELGVDVAVRGLLGTFRHGYTHFRVTLHAFHCELKNGEPQSLVHDALRWAAPLELPSYPMGKIDRQIALQLSAPGPG
jgi:A/G-specific adenine glycosylase